MPSVCVILGDFHGKNLALILIKLMKSWTCISGNKATASEGVLETVRSSSEMIRIREAIEYPHFSQVSGIQTRILTVGACPPIGMDRVSKATPPRTMEILTSGAEGSGKIFRALKTRRRFLVGIDRRPLRGSLGWVGGGRTGVGVGFKAVSKTSTPAGAPVT